MNFFASVYETVKKIPKGKVASYGQVATVLGNPRMSRQVGWALHANPFFGEVPCHRIVSKDGKVAKNFAFGGEDVQIKMLEDEGIMFDKNFCVLREFFVDSL
jgi:methylated-DNA-protein-cysteine methyltransferase-like protein